MQTWFMENDKRKPLLSGQLRVQVWDGDQPHGLCLELTTLDIPFVRSLAPKPTEQGETPGCPPRSPKS
jgi:hypothetical protein